MSELEKHLAMPYTTVLRRDAEGDFVARIEELPGCSAHGKTEEEALQNLAEAKRLWIEDSLENGDPVPTPAMDESLPSGKWLQRVPRRLHRKLQNLARKEGVSFNQFVTALLAEAVGERKSYSESLRPAAPRQHSEPARIGHYFLYDNFELLPPDWQVVNVSDSLRAQTKPWPLTGALSLFTSKISNASTAPLKVKKDAGKKHTPFQTL